MGREVKRVALDWSWPIYKVWEGYLDPTGQYADDWMPTEPPAGEGWQMWETTSEGSPISPVCSSPEELARWLADHEASAFAYATASYEAWLGMIRAGWAPSAVVSDSRGLLSGVEFMAGGK